MGVTIHFEGKLKSDLDFDQVIVKAKEFALANNMPYELFSEPYKKLERVKDEQNWDYEGPVRGIKIQPDPDSDPLWLEFDKNNYVAEFCKTQFAGIEIHLKLISFLREIEPLFAELEVTDEGEYWETNDIVLLQKRLDDYFKAAEELKAENPKIDGPFRLKDGRIVDLMEED